MKAVAFINASASIVGHEKMKIGIKLSIALAFIALLPLHVWYIFSFCGEFPLVAFLPAIALLASSPLAYSCRKTKRRRSTAVVLVMGLAWLAYAVWEQRVHSMVDPVDVPIRADLVLILPFLWFGAGKVVEVFLEEWNPEEEREGQHQPGHVR